ncbi:MAG: hypothetical protein ABFS12_17150, partial [Bacteroidota bacterium]
MKNYKNLGYFSILLIPITFLAFYKTYFIQFPNFVDEKINVYTHLHTVISSIWIFILIAQPLLIVYKKNKLHRMIGKLTYILFPLLILSFIPLIINKYYSEHPKTIFFPIAGSILLIILYSLAIYNKKNVSKHMRFMIGTALVFLGPTIGRIGFLILGLSHFIAQYLYYGTIYLILISLILYDKKNNDKYQPYILM